MATYYFDMSRTAIDFELEGVGDTLAIVDDQFVIGRRNPNWCELALHRLPGGSYLLQAEQFTLRRGETRQDVPVSISLVVCGSAWDVTRALEDADEAPPDLAQELLHRAAKRDSAFKEYIKEHWWGGWIDA